MIRILGIAGSPVKEGNTEVLLKEALRVVASDPKVETRVLNLSGMEIAGCRHCNGCIKNQSPEKFCSLSDGMEEIYPALLRADAIILATPVHIGRMSGLMANMIDRMRVFVYGNALIECYFPALRRENMISNVLFDLDGTLTDPKEGITRCIQFSLGR